MLSCMCSCHCLAFKLVPRYLTYPAWFCYWKLVKMQSVFADAKFCRNTGHSALFHPALQSSREEFLIEPLRKCADLALRFLEAVLLCYFLLFTLAVYFRCEWGPTQNLFTFVVVWHDSLNRCRWVLRASKKGMESRSMAGSFLVLVLRSRCLPPAYHG